MDNWVTTRNKVPAVLTGGALGAFFVLLGIAIPNFFFSSLHSNFDKTPPPHMTTDSPNVAILLKKQHKPLISVPRNLSRWKLWVLENNDAVINESHNDGHVTEVNIKRAPTNQAWHIQLNRMPLAVKGGEWYSLRFKARADALRTMVVAVSQAHEPWIALSPYHEVPLIQEWQDIKLELKIREDDHHARIAFNLGGWSIPVQIADVRFLQLSHGSPKWWLKLSEGNEAELQIQNDLLRVAIARTQKVNPQTIQLSHTPIHIQANDHYLLKIQARADAPRSIKVVMSQTNYPWEVVGLEQSIQLDPELRNYELPFVGSQSEDNSQLHFDLGGNPTSLEFGEVILQRILSTQPL